MGKGKEGLQMKNVIKGIWQFCSYLFWPRWGRIDRRRKMEDGRCMKEEVVSKLMEFIENEARSCSMDFGCITPEYVYRMWGGEFSIEEIEEGLTEIRKHRVRFYKKRC